MKRAYTKKVYSGRKVNLKRSRAALQRHYGPEVTSRTKAWREDSANKQGTSTSTLDEDSAPEPNLQTKTYVVHQKRPKPLSNSSNIPSTSKSTQDNIQIKTYARPKKKPIAMPISWPSCEAEIETHELTIENEPPHKLQGLDGYRIVDIKHVLNWALSLQSNHLKTCTYSQVKFINELRDGLSSTFLFQCDICMKTWHMDSEEEEKINKSFVWGTLTAASYFSQSTHLLAIMDIPSMSAAKFKKIEIDLGKTWQDQLWQEMELAATQEKEIAIQKGHVGTDGVPHICVYVDGGWSKRSYGHNFNVFSGVACIIGVETKKCLFLGIKNKYCNMCIYNEKKGVQKKHMCIRNYKGSSTGMEVDILLEGFSKSIELHGLRYTSFVGDGDSSVFARFKDKVPYGNIIQKQECKNHVIKNYTRALYKISGDLKLPLAGRKILSSKLQRLTTVARLNIQHNSQNTSKMRKDLKNGILHVFGQHYECDSYYCRWKKAEQRNEVIEADENLVPELKKQIAVWTLIETAINNVARKADRLLGNLTNNVAENFMSLMVKYNCVSR